MEQALFNIVKYGTPPQKAVKKITSLIQDGADPNTHRYCEHNGGPTIEHKFPLIYVAVREGHIHVIKTLVDNGVKINYKVDVSVLVYALQIWNAYYTCKPGNVQINTNKSFNKYYKLWPVDTEEKYYRIVEYLFKNNTRLPYYKCCNKKNTNEISLLKKFYARKKQIERVKLMFVFVINQKTNSSVGNSIMQMLEAENEFYLHFDSIVM
jgi:hypothetical protein